MRTYQRKGLKYSDVGYTKIYGLVFVVAALLLMAARSHIHNTDKKGNNVFLAKGHSRKLYFLLITNSLYEYFLVTLQTQNTNNVAVIIERWLSARVKQKKEHKSINTVAMLSSHQKDCLDLTLIL